MSVKAAVARVGVAAVALIALGGCGCDTPIDDDDGGTRDDGGVPADAGGQQDAGTRADAGASGDAGSSDDAGTSSTPVSRAAATVLLDVVSDADGATVPVYVAFPNDRTAPVGAVVVLHGSGGPWADEDTNDDGIADLCHVGEPSRQTREWRDLLVAEGWVAAFVDSYSPRGTCENEGAYKDPPLKFLISGTFVRPYDAYAAAELLRDLVWDDDNAPIVAPDRLALVGFSDGGTAGMATLYDVTATPGGWEWHQSFSGVDYVDEILAPPAPPPRGGYRAGVLYYAGAYHQGYYGSLCQPGSGIYRNAGPLLLHLPSDDSLTPNARCAVDTMNANQGAAVTVYEYDATDHGFDGNVEPESAEARTRSVTFLHAQLDDAP